MSHTPECCYMLPSFGERGWQATDLAQELQGAGGVAAATQTITIQTNRPVLLGRLELEYEDTVIASTATPQGLLVAGLPLIASQGGSDLSVFKPRAPGLTDANYLGVPLMPLQTFTIAVAFTGGNSRLSARVLTRLLSDDEVAQMGNTDPFVAGYRLLYGMPPTTIGAGAAGQLVMTVERPIQAGFNLGMLVLAALPGVGKFDLVVDSVTVAGVAIDQEVTQAAVAWTHYDFQNARGRGMRLKSMLPVGSRVIVNVTNTTAAPIVVQGTFIRTPEFGSALSGGVEQSSRPFVGSSRALEAFNTGLVPSGSGAGRLSSGGSIVLGELRQRPGMLSGLSEDEAEDVAEVINFLGDDETVRGTIRNMAAGKVKPITALKSFRAMARNRGVTLPSDSKANATRGDGSRR